MTWIFLLSLVLVSLFGFVLLFGAPYLPTLRDRTTDALDMLDLLPGQTLLELGSGDGRVLREAAKRGIHVVGYELNPLLVIWSKLRHWRYRHLITIRWGNYWRKSLPETDGIYVFLLNPYMEKLHTKIMKDKQSWASKKRVKVVSFAFEIPDKTHIEERNGLFLYSY